MAAAASPVVRPTSAAASGESRVKRKQGQALEVVRAAVLVTHNAGGIVAGLSRPAARLLRAAEGLLRSAVVSLQDSLEAPLSYPDTQSEALVPKKKRRARKRVRAQRTSNDKTPDDAAKIKNAADGEHIATTEAAGRSSNGASGSVAGRARVQPAATRAAALAATHANAATVAMEVTSTDGDPYGSDRGTAGPALATVGLGAPAAEVATFPSKVAAKLQIGSEVRHRHTKQAGTILGIGPAAARVRAGGRAVFWNLDDFELNEVSTKA